MPFDERGRPLLWLAPEVGPTADVGAWAASGAWNFGAERLWIGPELRLMVKDRGDFDGSYELSSAMDPGSWESPAAPAGASGSAASEGTHDSQGTRRRRLALRQELSLPVHQPDARLALVVEQTMALTADPARRWRESEGLKHLGWAREVTMRRREDDPRTVACQAWVLAQVEASATVVVPGAGAAAVTDYFEPIDEAHLDRRGEDLVLALTGERRFKVGVRTAEHRGVVASWRALEDGQAALLVRYFQDAPSSRYLEQPPGLPDHEGDSLYVYNDDGRFGSFGEIEALGRALETTLESVSDVFEMHVWWGERAPLRALAHRLLGMDIAVAWTEHGVTPA